MKTLQESIVHYQYSVWNETEKDPDRTEGNIGWCYLQITWSAIILMICATNSTFFIILNTWNDSLQSWNIHIKIRSVELKVIFFYVRHLKWVEIWSGKEITNSLIDSPMSRCNLINLLKHMCLNKSTGWQYSHCTVAWYFPEFIYVNNA